MNTGTSTSPAKISIPQFKEIIEYLGSIIKASEFENHTFVVGGCIRDMIMESDIHDIDICVDIPNGGILLAQWLCKNGYAVGEPVIYERFGTACVHLKKYDMVLELVQTRQESYPDAHSRNPVTCFGSIQYDAYRRDLTINALYLNISTGEILDITGCGRKDITDKYIRTTDHALRIFDDDPLRILRVIRFAHKFGTGWKVDPDVISAMSTLVSRLSIVSRERFGDEINKMTQNPKTLHSVLTMLSAVGCFNVFTSWKTEVELINDAIKGFVSGKYPLDYITGASDMQLAFWTSVAYIAMRNGTDHGLDPKKTLNNIQNVFEFCFGLPANAICKPARKIIDVLDNNLSGVYDIIAFMEHNTESYLQHRMHHIQHQCKTRDVYGVARVVIATIWKAFSDYEDVKSKYPTPEDFLTDNVETPEPNRGYHFNIKDVMTGTEIMEQTGLEPGKEVGGLLESMTNVCLALPNPMDYKEARERCSYIIDAYNNVQRSQNAV